MQLLKEYEMLLFPMETKHEVKRIALSLSVVGNDMKWT